MKRIVFFLFACVCVAAVSSCGRTGERDGWSLVWSDEFDQEGFLDSSVWEKHHRGRQWGRFMADYDTLVTVHDGNLIIRGIVNNIAPDDTAGFLTGAVDTKGKKSFEDGKLAIRAKFGGSQGAWAALWMMPEDGVKWPLGGEIDIVEHLSYDVFAYQTVHSYYTNILGISTNPPFRVTEYINPADYNEYSVEMYRDSVVFGVNGRHTLTYPRVASADPDEQFPYFKPFYLLMGFGLGGHEWVGDVVADDLPVEMWIDWVRFYKKRD